MTNQTKANKILNFLKEEKTMDEVKDFYYETFKTYNPRSETRKILNFLLRKKEIVKTESGYRKIEVKKKNQSKLF